MKKNLLFAMLVMICMCYLPTAYAVNTQGCETALPGIILDTKIPNTVHTIIVVIKIVTTLEIENTCLLIIPPIYLYFV